MTDPPQPNPKPRATQVGIMFLRVLSAAAGLAAILGGTVLPVAYIVAMDSAWGFLPALGFAGICGWAAFLLIWFAIKGPKSS